jgi:hypothetical protein
MNVAGPPFDWNFETIREIDEMPRPVIPARIRGRQTLKPYDSESSEALKANQSDGGVQVNPESGAPEDQ